VKIFGNDYVRLGLFRSKAYGSYTVQYAFAEVLTSWEMYEATGAVSGVDALAAGSGGPHELILEVAVMHAHRDLSWLGQDCHTARPHTRNHVYLLFFMTLFKTDRIEPSYSKNSEMSFNFLKTQKRLPQYFTKNYQSTVPYWKRKFSSAVRTVGKWNRLPEAN
jgi:hypothetical protein